MIPNGFIQDLLARADIVEVVGRHVELKRGGANFSGLCPFHSEKSPSFTVSPSKQFYHCFGCGAHGNAVGFLMEYSGMGFVDAVHDLAQQTGMTVPEDDSTPEERERATEQKKRQATLVDVLTKACDHYRRELKKSPRGIEYLKGRGLTGEIAARFGLGYAREGWRGLASVFAEYDDPLLEESGLVIAKADDKSAAEEAGGTSAGPPQVGPHPPGGSDDILGGRGAKRYDRFRDRIMFPIRSVQGEVIGFGGRVLDRGEPKYLNSPETPVFVKGRELYGLFEGRTAIRDRGYALVVEGYMDVVALAQSGFANAVATLGTACTPEHVHKLFRFTDSVVFSFDGDAAGRRAARRALEAALPHATDTRTVRFLFLPPEHDPDSYVREHGSDAFEQCIEQAVPLSKQLVEASGEGCDLETAEGRAQLLAHARPLWAQLPDGALKRQLLGDLARAGGLSVDELASLWKLSAPPSRQTFDKATTQAARRTPGRANRVAANLLDRALWLLIQRIELWTTLDGDSHDLLASQPAPYDSLFARLERSLNDHGALAAPALLDELKTACDDEDAAAGAAAVVARIASLLDPEPTTDLQRELRISLDGLRLAAVDDELKLLAETQPLSEAALQRGRELSELRVRLRTAIETTRVPEQNR